MITLACWKSYLCCYWILYLSWTFPVYFYIYLTTLCLDGEGEGRGVIATGVRSPSIMVKTPSGMSVASLHWSCQLFSFDVRMSLACPVAEGRRRYLKKTWAISRKAAEQRFSSLWQHNALKFPRLWLWNHFYLVLWTHLKLLKLFCVSACHHHSSMEQHANSWVNDKQNVLLDNFVPYHGRWRSDRTTCSACLPGNRSVSSPPTEPPYSHLRGTTACPSDGLSTFPGTDNKHRRNIMSAKQ